MAANGDGCFGGVECILGTVDEGSLESKKYYLARRTVLEMLRDRGYAVSFSDLSLSLSDFRAVFGQKPDLQRLRISTSRLSWPSRKILVIFCGTAEIRLQTIVGILSQIVNRDSLDKVILVLERKMNFHSKKVIDQHPVTVETFHITELLVNITKHLLMPEHQVLSVEEKQKLLKTHNVEEKQIPLMLESDALAKYYGLQKGQVVKFTYSGPITESDVTYRCVV